MLAIKSLHAVSFYKQAKANKCGTSRYDKQKDSYKIDTNQLLCSNIMIVE